MLSQRQQFQDRVGDLVEQVKRWVEPNEWATKLYPKRLRDSTNEVFEIPALFLQKGPIKLLLDPVAYDVPGSEGVVDLYLMPTYDDTASLYFKNGTWELQYNFPREGLESETDSDSKTLPMTEDTFNKALDSIALHAEPSF